MAFPLLTMKLLSPLHRANLLPRPHLIKKLSDGLGRHVLSTECRLCQTRITECAKEALKLSFGFDLGGKDILRERKQKPGKQQIPSPTIGSIGG